MYKELRLPLKMDTAFWASQGSRGDQFSASGTRDRIVIVAVIWLMVFNAKNIHVIVSPPQNETSPSISPGPFGFDPHLTPRLPNTGAIHLADLPFKLASM
jgi:hypothetical protein